VRTVNAHGCEFGPTFYTREAAMEKTPEPTVLCNLSEAFLVFHLQVYGLYDHLEKQERYLNMIAVTHSVLVHMHSSVALGSFTRPARHKKKYTTVSH
jgi:hypothetical protein